ncbi:MAG: hypothetical protein RMK52_01710 [Chitinophagales bacterium]|nr:hypothetical protein [Chitinophagales bacterium]MDW8392940.1 hypothetical protein [Chitinophagales bacterium]
MQRNRWYKLFQTVGLMVLAFFVLAVLTAAVQHQAMPRTSGVHAIVTGPEEISFVDETELIGWLAAKQIAAEGGMPVRSLRTAELEQELLLQPYVAGAQVFVDAQNRLCVRVRQKLPVIRIINSHGVSYYLDESGSRLPRSDKFTARVPVATREWRQGQGINKKDDSLFTDGVLKIVRQVRSDTFLLALVEQIHRNADGDFELIPFHGKHRIVIGDAEHLNEKLGKIRPLYRELMRSGRWDDYDRVDVRFHQQVYCSRRSHSAAQAQEKANASFKPFSINAN